MSAEDDRLYLETKAKQGDAKAQFGVGLWYFSGQGGQPDYAKAVEWFSKAAEQGECQAQSKLGMLYFSGQGVTEDEAKAAEWFLKAAQQGDARSQFYTGLLSQNDAESFKWYGKAAEQGDADAQYELGLLYFNGQGVPKDHEKAKELFVKAGAQGNERAKDFLAKEEATGESKNEVVENFRKKAEQGDADAQYDLGLLYLRGEGVPQDREKAIEWFEKAALQGRPGAILLLEKMGCTSNYILERAKTAWREKKAEEERLPKAREAAAKLQAAEQGDANSQYKLGLQYLSGNGVPRDYVKGVEWLEKAAAQDHAEAKDWLAKEEKKKAKEKKRIMGRIIAPVLAVLSIIFCFVGFADELSWNTLSISLSIFIAIPFLVLYFSDSDSKILRGIFFGVAVLISLGMVFIAFSILPNPEEVKIAILFIVMCISFMASCITAMIFPRD
jgi:TPR repeat protein